jgi:large subunit ribosomal protein L21
MFAIVETGGKQYQVSKGDKIFIEKLPEDVGSHITFDRVLMVSEDDNHKIGAPFIEGAQVKGTVVDQKKSDKVIVFKKKRRQNYRRKRGHRQSVTAVEVTDIFGL